MNEAMRFAARPEASQNNGIPAEAIAMARQLGLSSEDLKKLPAMWKNLDDLSESDPETYRSFTENILAEGPPNQGGKARSFVPNASFVVKLKAVADGGSGTVVKTRGAGASQKMFVNMTSHPALERPKDQFGRPVEDGEKRGADGMQIPLLVGEVRNCADHTGESSCAVAVDVVFHDWVITRCEDDNSFKAQAVDLALSWIKQETGYKLENGWKTIKSKYKGGFGEIGDTPLPFPISKAMEQDEPIEQRPSKEERKEDGGEEPPPVIPSLATLSPENILEAKNGGSSSGGGASGGLSGDRGGHIKMPGDIGSSGVSGGGRVLIEEVVPTSGTSGDKEEEKKGKKKGAAVKKGFLNSAGKSGPKLYGDDGSSGDGQKEGSYSRLMSKCKVVDMSSMSKEDQKKAMEQHAAGGNGGAPRQAPQTEAPPAPPAPPKAPSAEAEKARQKPSFDGMGKGFLSGGKGSGKSLYGEEGSPEGTTPRKGDDALFDSLVAGIDPDYAEASKPLPEESNGTMSALGDIANILSGGNSGCASLLGEAALPLRSNMPDLMEPLRGLDDEISRPKAPTAGSLLHDVVFEQDADSGKRSCRVTVKLPKEGSIDPASIDVQTSADIVRVMAPGKEPLDVTLPFEVGQTRAKFSKKKSALVVTALEIE